MTSRFYANDGFKGKLFLKFVGLTNDRKTNKKRCLAWTILMKWS